jgi:uncharacterized protein (DUF305 family)
VSVFDAPPAPPVAPEADAPSSPGDEPPAARRGLSGLQVGVLLAAIAFLAGAIGFVLGERSEGDPLSSVDVGFMQDMGYHHDQAIEMSLLLLSKDDVDPDLASFATEIIIGQRYEQGVFSALLDRWGHSSDPGDTVMDWMSQPMAAAEMEGLATPEQMDELRAADGAEAEALWIALMSEHHLAGMHMADHAARYGSDDTVVNLATAMVRYQRSEVLDIARYRERAGLPIPDGFSDPTQDQRLDPLSLPLAGD